MRIKYSQKWSKILLHNRIKDLCKYIPVNKAGVLLKVFCYIKTGHNPDFYFRGHYRYTPIHRVFYSEVKGLKRIPLHIITLKFYPEISDERLLYLLGHEFSHLRDYRKHKGKKHKCSQKRADKFAYKCIGKWQSKTQHDTQEQQ